MRIYNGSYYFNFILITIVLLGCQQEKALAQYSRIPVDRIKEGLKDSVKSISCKSYRLYDTDTISNIEFRNKYAGYTTDLRGFSSYELYAPDGRFLLSENNRHSLTQPLDSMKSARYVWGTKYDLKSYNKKQKFKIPYTYHSEVYNPYQVYVTKVTYHPITRAKEKNGHKYLKDAFYRYEYIYDEKGVKILKDIKYFCFDRNKDGIIDVDGKDTVYITNYTYDTKDRLIRKEFDMSVLRERSLGFSALESEHIYDHINLTVPIWYASWQEFEYDDRDNVIRYSLKNSLEKTGTKEYLEYEDKYYYTDDNILYKIDRYSPGSERSSFGRVPANTDRRILRYNEKGHLIKSEGIPHKTDTIAVTRLYTYEYDERNNWTRCNIYLNGKIEEKPHVYIDRYIEYYN